MGELLQVLGIRSILALSIANRNLFNASNSLIKNHLSEKYSLKIAEGLADHLNVLFFHPEQLVKDYMSEQLNSERTNPDHWRNIQFSLEIHKKYREHLKERCLMEYADQIKFDLWLEDKLGTWMFHGELLSNNRGRFIESAKDHYLETRMYDYLDTNPDSEEAMKLEAVFRLLIEWWPEEMPKQDISELLAVMAKHRGMLSPSLKRRITQKIKNTN